MCFSEFIGYTCGHTSPEVLRPCPMTTNSHTNPVCSSHGRRPILAEEMCPACQRILHGRAVLILEWEHHWMHERGVCGCPVVFPDLIQPRVVGRDRNSEATEQIRNEASKENKTSRGGKTKSKGKSEGKDMTTTSTLPKTRPASLPERPATNWNGVPFKKASVEGNSAARGKGRPVEAEEVRIPSLYGVEWIDEHRQLHEAGSCGCAGDFSFYQTPEAYRKAFSSSSRNGREQAVHAAHLYSSGGQAYEGQAFSYSSGPAPYSSHTYLNNSTAPVPQNAMDLNCLQGPQNPGTWDQSYPTQPSHSQEYQDWHQGTGTGTQPGNRYQAYQSWAQTGHRQQPGNMYQGTQPLQPPSFLSHVGLPVRSPGAIYQVDPTRSTNPLYNYACVEGAKIGPYVDAQTVDYPRAGDAPDPLVGLPIGAGPEAPGLLSHVGPFDRCVLRRGGGDPAPAGARAAPRPLRSRRASVACLRELKVPRSPAGARGRGAGRVAGREAEAH